MFGLSEAQGTVSGKMARRLPNYPNAQLSEQMGQATALLLLLFIKIETTPKLFSLYPSRYSTYYLTINLKHQKTSRQDAINHPLV